ncbi:MAG: hypothetical protein LBB34_01570 [Holosporales bacterium]|jgi:hypothetical protein|nr:hypothetical protein [Holosporales bacterium]
MEILKSAFSKNNSIKDVIVVDEKNPFVRELKLLIVKKLETAHVYVKADEKKRPTG